MMARRKSLCVGDLSRRRWRSLRRGYSINANAIIYNLSQRKVRKAVSVADGWKSHPHNLRLLHLLTINVVANCPNTILMSLVVFGVEKRHPQHYQRSSIALFVVPRPV